MKSASLRTTLAILTLASGCSSAADKTIGTTGAKAEASSSNAPTSANGPPTKSDTVASDAPAWQGIPKPPAEVMSAINRSGRAPYEGKTAVLKGHVTITGDDPPASEMALPTDGSCPEAAATYGKAFRVGQDHALADALVTVTDYDAFVPPERPAVTVKARGCAFDRRTVGMTFGQRLEIVNDDAHGSYMPFLDGAEYRAVMMAVAHGDPIKLYPFQPAINYVLRDYQGRDYLQADVLVLKFSTLDVTGLDGSYTIGRIPVGKVTVNAYLPAIGKSVEKKVEVHEGDNTLDLELTYDKATDKVRARPPGPFARGTDPNREAVAEGKFGAPPKRPSKNEVPR